LGLQVIEMRFSTLGFVVAAATVATAQYAQNLRRQNFGAEPSCAVSTYLLSRHTIPIHLARSFKCLLLSGAIGILSLSEIAASGDFPIAS
jgi:hypothetical protein